MNERMKELKIMKTTKRYTILICLLAIAAVVHAKAVSYQTTHRSGYSQPAYGVAVTATAPSATFQSTSAYSSQWTVQENSMLNNDGSVNTEAYMGVASNAPRKAPGGGSGPGGNGPGTPGGDLDPTTQQPLGDVVLPLLLMALAYALHSLVLRRRRNTLL